MVCEVQTESRSGYSSGYVPTPKTSQSTIRYSSTHQLSCIVDQSYWTAPKKPYLYQQPLNVVNIKNWVAFRANTTAHYLLFISSRMSLFLVFLCFGQMLSKSYSVAGCHQPTLTKASPDQPCTNHSHGVYKIYQLTISNSYLNRYSVIDK